MGILDDVLKEQAGAYSLTKFPEPDKAKQKKGLLDEILGEQTPEPITTKEPAKAEAPSGLLDEILLTPEIKPDIVKAEKIDQPVPEQEKLQAAKAPWFPDIVSRLKYGELGQTSIIGSAVKKGLLDRPTESLGGAAQMAGEFTGLKSLASAGKSLAEYERQVMADEMPVGITPAQAEWAEIISSVSNNVGSLVLGGAVTKSLGVTKGLAQQLYMLTPMGAQVIGKTYNEAREKDLSPVMSAVTAGGHAIMEVGPEMITLGGWIKHMNKPGVKKVFNLIVPEVVTELMTTTGNAMIDKRTGLRGDMTWVDFANDVEQTIRTVPAHTLLMGAVTSQLPRVERTLDRARRALPKDATTEQVLEALRKQELSQDELELIEAYDRSDGFTKSASETINENPDAAKYIDPDALADHVTGAKDKQEQETEAETPDPETMETSDLETALVQKHGLDVFDRLKNIATKNNVPDEQWKQGLKELLFPTHEAVPVTDDWVAPKLKTGAEAETGVTVTEQKPVQAEVTTPERRVKDLESRVTPTVWAKFRRDKTLSSETIDEAVNTGSADDIVTIALIETIEDSMRSGKELTDKQKEAIKFIDALEAADPDDRMQTDEEITADVHVPEVLWKTDAEDAEIAAKATLAKAADDKIATARGEETEGQAIARKQGVKLDIVTPKELSVDAEFFQFREEGEEAQRKSLKDKEFDPEQLGVLDVWYEPSSGKTWVVNGHNRFDKIEAVQYPIVPVRYIQAQTRESARAIGAIRNIGQGSGTEMDTALFLKETKRRSPEQYETALRKIPTTKAVVKRGIALSHLPNELLTDIRIGALDKDLGVIMGEKLKTESEMRAVAKAIERKGAFASKAWLEEYIRFRDMAPTVKEEQTGIGLFGPELQERKIFDEMVDVSTQVQNILGSDKKLAIIAKRAAMAESKGVAQVDADKARELVKIAKENLEVYKALSNKKGNPISDVLKLAAVEVTQGGDKNVAANKAAAIILRHLDEFTRRGKDKDHKGRTGTKTTSKKGQAAYKAGESFYTEAVNQGEYEKRVKSSLSFPIQEMVEFARRLMGKVPTVKSARSFIKFNDRKLIANLVKKIMKKHSAAVGAVRNGDEKAMDNLTTEIIDLMRSNSVFNDNDISLVLGNLGSKRAIKDILEQAYLRGKPLGIFQHPKSTTEPIEPGEAWPASLIFRSDVARNPEMAAKMISHEIGHARDFGYKGAMGGKGLLGKIMNLQEHMEDSMPSFPGAPGKITQAERNEWAETAEKEAKERAKLMPEILEEIITEEPIYSELGITAEDILEIWNGINSEVNPELYDFIQRAGRTDKVAIVKQAMKGIVDASLQRFGGKIVGTKIVREIKVTKVTAAVIKEWAKNALKNKIAEEMEARQLIEASVIREELINLSTWWTPFDPTANPEYTAYRYKAEELYAEMFSVFMNDPAEFQKRAPVAFRAVTNWFGQEKIVQDLYEEIRDEISQGPEHLQDRRTKEAIDKYKEASEKYNKTREDQRDKVLDFKTMFVDSNSPYYAWEKKHGVKSARVRNALERISYATSSVEGYLKRGLLRARRFMFSKNVGFDEVGHYTAMNRIIQERSEIFNFQGENLESATAYMNNLDPKKKKLLEAAAIAIWDAHNDFVVPLLESSGMFSAELMDAIRDRKQYVTFNPIRKIEAKNAIGSIGPTIAGQIGDVDYIMNPIEAMILKDISLIRHVKVNNGKKAMLAFMRKVSPADARKSKMVFDGDKMVVQDTREAGFKTIRIMQHGKVVGYDIPIQIAEMFERNPGIMDTLDNVVGWVNEWFRKSFTELRTGFHMTNLNRDVRTAYKNLPRGTARIKAFGLLKSFIKALPIETRDFLNLEDDYLNYMLQEDQLISVADDRGLTTDDRVHERMLYRYQLSEKRWGNMITRPIRHGLQLIGDVGRAAERITKVAGSLYLDEYTDLTQDEKSVIIRSRVGSPAFRNNGKLKLLNIVTLFSNPMIQGTRASIESFKSNPAEYTANTVLQNIIPKTIMFFIAKGLMSKYFGWDDEPEEIMRKVSEYNKTNYTIIPLGLTDTGKAVVFRLPEDEAGRFIGGVYWKALNGLYENNPGAFEQVFDFTGGQLPSMNPMLEIMSASWTYTKGENPRDWFRNRQVIPRDLFEADDPRKKEYFMKHIWNKSPASLLHTFNTESIGEIKGQLEKFLDTPGIADTLGRFLVVTDRGEYEHYRRISGAVAKTEAQIRVDTDETIDKLYKNDAVTTKELALLKVRYMNSPGSFVRKMYTLRARRSGNAFIKAFVSAKSQAQKKAIFDEYIRLTKKGD